VTIVPTTFRAWLTARRYRATTVRQYVGAVDRARLQVEQGDPVEARYRPPVRAYTAYLDQTRSEPDWVDLALRDWLAAPRERAPPKTRQPIAPFDADDWRKLVRALATDPEPEARVIEIQTVTGLRTGDVLRLRRRALKEALAGSHVVQVELKGARVLPVPTSGAPEVWERLAKQWREGDTLAKWVSPASADADAGAAYIAVRKHFQLLAQDLGLHGPIHLHRLRHTVADLALTATKDINAVRIMLGHQNIATTMRYIDDRSRINDVATIHRTIREGL
jgi:integrase